jgi:uncharacterized protein YggE
MKTIILSMLLVPVSFAGSINVKGISNIGTTPDYIELKIQSIAKCFKTAKESNTAVGELSSKVQDVLKKHIDLKGGDQLVVTAGRSVRQNEIERHIDPMTNRGSNRVICEKGWKSSRDIIVKFTNLSAFEALNPELLDLIDLAELEQRSLDNGIISAIVGEPVPRLKVETTEGLEEQALKEALINASNKFQTIKELCDLQNASISGISESSSVVRPYQDGTGSGSSNDSLNFALQYIHLAYNISFSFDNTSGACSEQSSLL